VDWTGNSARVSDMLSVKPYHWILLELQTPGVEPAALVRTVRSTAPDTRLMLMAPCEVPGLAERGRRWGFDAWLSKPFTMYAMHQALCAGQPATAQVIVPAETRAPRSGTDRAEARASVPLDMKSTSSESAPQPEATPQVRQILDGLLAETRARVVLLLTSAGYLVDAAGQTHGLHLPTLSALIAANYAAGAELSKQMGNRGVFSASHYQGPDCHIYTQRVGEERLLAVIFDSGSRPGAVWLYARKASTQLDGILVKETAQTAVEKSLVGELQAQLNDLFEGESDSSLG